MPNLYCTAFDNQSRPSPNQPVGVIEFPRNEISLVRTPDGAILNIAYVITFTGNIEASFSAVYGNVGLHRNNSRTALGIAIDPQCRLINTTHRFSNSPPVKFIKGCLQLRLSLTALEAIERLRENDPPEFTVVLHGSALVRRTAPSKSFDACSVQIDGSSDQPIYIKVDRDTWVRNIALIAPLGSVLIEIPLKANRKAPWDEVWKHLDAASAHLAQGGQTGASDCVKDIRAAIKQWSQIDSFDLGKPKTGRIDRQSRLQNIACGLWYYCSVAEHPEDHQVEWRRSDAVLAVATLTALLSACDP